MAEELCTIVTSPGGDRWVHLPQSNSVFHNHTDFDGNPQGWSEAQCSWMSISRAWYDIESAEENQPIPADLRRAIRRARQGKSPRPVDSNARRRGK